MIDDIFIGSLCICLLGIGFCIYMFYRNDQVAAYRQAIIDRVFSFSDYKWRNDVYKSVSYNDMVYKFWKPLDSFYPDKTFLQEK